MFKKNLLVALSPRYFLLCILVLIAFFLRFYLIPQNLFFGYEQGRDFLVIRDIVMHHKLTLIGSKTDIEGVFHGPIFYYLAAIPFYLSKGDPVFVEGFFILLQSISVFLIYCIGKQLFNRRTGIIAATIFTFSFACIVYARWLSNPPLSIPFVCLFFIAFVCFLKADKKYVLLLSIALGFLLQIQFLNIIFFLGIFLVACIYYRKRFIAVKPLLLVLAFLLFISISFGTYVLFEIRHEFLIAKSVLNLLSGHSGYYTTYLQAVVQTIESFFITSSFIVSPFFWPLAIVFVLAGVGVVYKQSRTNSNSFLLLFFLFVPLVLLVFLHHDILEHYFIPLFIPIILTVSVFIDKVWERAQILGVVCLLTILFLNFFSWFINIPKNYYIFFQTTQPNLKYSDQIKTVDIIYENARGNQFAYQAYTIPYWSPQAWEYLFSWYGKNKYGYIPISQEKAKIIFVIIQKDPTLYQKLWLQNTVSKWGVLSGTFQVGVLKTQKRLD